jgi:hypothetical protein
MYYLSFNVQQVNSLNGLKTRLTTNGQSATIHKCATILGELNGNTQNTFEKDYYEKGLGLLSSKNT